MLPLLAQLGDGFWMPPQASTKAESVDWLFFFLYWASVAAFTLIMATMVLFLIRYRHRPGHKARRSPSHSTSLELTWSIIPTLIFLMMFWWGFQGFIEMHTPPDDAYPITVRSSMWNWEFEYPNGVRSSTLVVPVNRPIHLSLTSEDVIHSLFIPAFRVKQDLVPGRINEMWFQATRVGDFDLYCAEYCGIDHSEMTADVLVRGEADFQRWMEGELEEMRAAEDLPPHLRGKRIFDQLGCAACHSVDGTRDIGPTLKDLYGYEREMTDGRTLMADQQYLRDQILNPRAQTVATFQAGLMAPYQGRVDERELSDLITYIRTLSDRGPSAEEIEREWRIERGEEVEDEQEDEDEDADEPAAEEQDRAEDDADAQQHNTPNPS